MRNFQTLFAIIAGLMSASVFRLKKSRELLSQETQQVWESFRHLVSLRSNFKMLRICLESCEKMPTVPYIGMFLADLKALHDCYVFGEFTQKQDELEKKGIKFVNWFIMNHEYLIIEHLQSWQFKYFPTIVKYETSGTNKRVLKLDKVETIQNLIKELLSKQNLKPVSTVYQESLKREPREN